MKLTQCFGCQFFSERGLMPGNTAGMEDSVKRELGELGQSSVYEIYRYNTLVFFVYDLKGIQNAKWSLILSSLIFVASIK